MNNQYTPWLDLGLTELEYYHRRFLEVSGEKADLMMKLESLTPGGSEFYQNPDRCIEFARERMNAIPPRIIRLTKTLETVGAILAGLMQYRQRNTLNFQLEKLDDYLCELNEVLNP